MIVYHTLTTPHLISRRVVSCHVMLTHQDGLTPLMIAAHNGHTRIVKILIESGADVSIRDVVRTHRPHVY